MFRSSYRTGDERRCLVFLEVVASASRAAHRQVPGLDIVRVQDTGLASEADPDVLRWAAESGRVLLTHEVATITAFASERIARGQAMPGVVEVRQDLPIGQAI